LMLDTLACSDKNGRVNNVLHFSAPKIERKMDA